MTELDIPKYNTFFEDYRSLESKFWDKKWEVEKSAFEAFQYRFFEHQKRMTEIRASEAPTYNIFSILGLGRYEVLLHSPLIKNLLDPKGSHGQGVLFLKTFFEKVLVIKYPEDQISYVRVREEFRMESGRIDLLITYSEIGIKKAIVIENKIYARDQHNQLARYYNYLKDFRGYAPENIILVYLTPDGAEPTEYSMNDSKKREVEDHSTLKCVSYRNGIKDWLNHAMEQIKSEKLKSIVNQYIVKISKL